MVGNWEELWDNGICFNPQTMEFNKLLLEDPIRKLEN